jgi:hypothetical protein
MLIDPILFINKKNPIQGEKPLPDQHDQEKVLLTFLEVKRILPLIVSMLIPYQRWALALVLKMMEDTVPRVWPLTCDF